MGILENIGLGMHKKGDKMMTKTQRRESETRVGGIEKLMKMNLNDSLRYTNEEESFVAGGNAERIDGVARVMHGFPVFLENGKLTESGETPIDAKYYRFRIDGELFEAAQFTYPTTDGARSPSGEVRAFLGRIEGNECSPDEAKAVFEKLQVYHEALGKIPEHVRQTIQEEAQQDQQ